VTGRRVPRDSAAWRRIAATGVLAALFQGCYFTAVSLTSVSLATLVTIGSAPVLVLLVRRRTAERRQVAAVVLALFGLGLLVGLPADDPGVVLAGSVFAVLAGAGFAVLTVLAARPIPGLDDMTTTGVGFMLGGALLVPVAAATSGLGFVPDVRTVGLLVALGVIPTAVAYTCYFRGLRSSSATVGVVMALLEPLTAAVLAALLLDDRLGAVGVTGAVLLGAAVILAGRGNRDRPVPERSNA
jgi:DME family drug/metabolite transporter